jgi:tRNA-Thr(GGU) m(6)t(6)A37 methyltransferase TsaA
MSDAYPPIGILKTCFAEKVGVPRQSGMMSEALGTLKLHPHPHFRAALEGLDQFSHLWILFVFHKNPERTWRPTIEPPRLGITKKMGVFASRSPHRPNPIGLSVVKLEYIDYSAEGGIEVHLSGVDILDGSPVLDVKPYLPYADRVDDATDGWAPGEVEHYPVEFSSESLAVIESASPEKHPRLRQFIIQMIERDPRPTSQRRSMPIAAAETEGIPFAFRVLDYDIHWHVRQGTLYVAKILELS